MYIEGFMFDIAIIGEVMLEFSPAKGKNYALGISGDTYNSACTLVGLGINVTYITSLGVGQPAELIRRDAALRQVKLLEPEAIVDKSPGLYIINNDEAGERCFNYWRDDSAAKALLNNEDLLFPLLTKIKDHDYIYFSGITLAVMSESCRSMLKHFMIDYRKQGGNVIFDPNYRPKLWLDLATATSAINEIGSYVDIYLPGFEEEEVLFGCTSPVDSIERLTALGINEVVIKNGPENCLLMSNNNVESIAVTPSTNVIDTTGAGDTFNGGYIGARLTGLTPKNAIDFALKAARQILSIKGGVLEEAQLVQLKSNLDRIINTKNNAKVSLS
jgi:2-dehydro-3-deoxygluconokinase